jgi:ribosomal protein S18 acetylase RimI-like enzyme
MTEDEVIEIVGARKEQAAEIASLIMEAMDYDCCQNFAGESHTLEDFHRMMTSLVEMEDSQYSYRNTLVALVDGQLAGCLVGYDGKDLRQLRKRFIEKAAEYLEQDFSNMDDETQAGEYYLDSLCVKRNFRKRGLATRLIKEAIKRHGSQPVGLLVDHTHPWAERLYRAIGFKYVNETTWGGHAMNHLQYPAQKDGLEE